MNSYYTCLRGSTAICIVPMIANILARPICDGGNWSSTHLVGFSHGLDLWDARGEVVATVCGAANSGVAS